MDWFSRIDRRDSEGGRHGHLEHRGGRVRLVAFLDQVGLAADDRVGYTEAPSGVRAALMFS